MRETIDRLNLRFAEIESDCGNYPAGVIIHVSYHDIGTNAAALTAAQDYADAYRDWQNIVKANADAFRECGDVSGESEMREHEAEMRWANAEAAFLVAFPEDSNG